MNYYKNCNKIIKYKGEVLWQNVQNVMELADNPAVFVGVVKDKFFAWAAADAVISNTQTEQKKPVNAAKVQKYIFL